MFEDIKDPEIVIGLVGPVGVDTRMIVQVLTEELRDLRYQAEEVRLSQLLHSLPKFKNLDVSPTMAEDERISKHMDAGDRLRRDATRGDALALLAMTAIANYRAKTVGQSNKPIPRQAYILNSLKHPDEIRALRKVYGKLFMLVSIYAPREARIEALAAKIASSRHSPDKSQFRNIAEELVENDANAGDDDYGQSVREAFPLGDFFVMVSDKEDVRRKLRRLLESWFCYPFHTPRQDEAGMFHAKAASLRSADLSRQVGAAITSGMGEILAVGCNEVPRAGGGAIWEGDDRDDRDFRIGFDASARMKHEIMAEVIQRLQDAKWLGAEKLQQGVEELTQDLLYGAASKYMKGARVTSIIEFGRIVHAEMAAIMDAACRGIPLEGAILYCTTFPCHMCARHILAAGVRRVVYIEPYPKSLAKDLYPRAISVDHAGPCSGAVSFEPFAGISPTRYIELFTMPPKRKDKQGQAIAWNKTESQPVFEQFYISYLDSEVAVGKYLSDNAKTFGLKPDDQSLEGA